MSVEQNKERAHRFHMEMLLEEKNDLIDELISPEFVAHVPGLPPEFTKGPEGIKKWFTAYRAGLSDMWTTHHDTIAEGDKVVIRFEGGGTHSGEMLGIPPSGKKITVSGIDTFRFVDGKFVEMWQQVDFMGMMQQMGVIPSQ